MKTLAIIWSLCTQTTYIAPTYSIVQEYVIENQLIENKNNTITYADETYQSLIEPYESYFYYGRILKYYYANSFIVDSKDITNLVNYLGLTTKINTNKTLYDALTVQNLVASTIMPSVYGSSSDAEFFAESFSKWLNTDDDLKNKSWEVTNIFFTGVLPELIKVGGLYKDDYSDTMSIPEKAIELVEATTSSKDFVKYDSTLTQKGLKALDLRYTNESIVWRQPDGNNPSNALDYILNQVYIEAYKKDVEISYKKTYIKEIFELLSSWIYDSYTPASSTSIESFNIFNNSYYATFEDLNTSLKNVFKTYNGESLVNFDSTYSAIESAYVNSTPSYNGLDSEKWTSAHTTLLKEYTLKMYNALYNLLSQNKHYTEQLVFAFIASPDFPLVGTETGTMGYTNTASYVSTEGGVTVSTAYSYVVITGPSLTFKKFNDQYSAGFWSSPNKFSVLIHEMGHVLDSFGSRLGIYRDSSGLSSKYSFSQLYKGKIFGDETTTTSNSSNIFWVFAGVSIGTILIVAVVVPTTVISKGKKRSSGPTVSK